MNNSKKLLAVLSTAAISTIIASAVATPASAKMASVLLRDASGKIYEYNYKDLQDSFAGGTALYDDFKAVKDAGAQVISYYDDVQNGFVSRSTILDAWGDAGDDFNPQTATETLTTTPVEGTIYERVENPDGTVSEQPKQQGVEVSSVSAINSTSIQLTVPSTVQESDLLGKQITLTADNENLTATYSDSSLTEDGKANFVLDDGNELTDAAEYTVSSDWASFTTNKFVAKVETPYIKTINVSTTGIPAAGTGDVHFTAKNQYGEDLGLTAENTTDLNVKGTLNGVPLMTNEIDDADKASGTIKINKPLTEGDKVSLTFTNTINGDAGVEIGTAQYTVVKAEDPVPTTISDITATKNNAVAKEVLPDDKITLSTVVKNQFNNPIDIPNVRWIVEDGIDLITPDDGNPIDESGIADANGSFKFTAKKAGNLKISAYLPNGQKSTYEVQIGAKTLTDLTVNSENTSGDNQDTIIVGSVKPNDGANLTPDQIKFDVKATKTSVDVTPADVQVTAKLRGGDDADTKDDIVIAVKSTKPGKYTITPYVGESLEKATAKAAGFDVTTTIDQNVASIDDITFDPAELKTGTDVVKDVTFRNKYGEAVLVDPLDAVVTPEGSLTGKVTIDGTKNILTLSNASAGSYQVTIAEGSALKSYTLKFTAPTFTKIDAGADITGVVAGDPATKAKDQAVKFLDQDGKDMPVKASDLHVSVTGPTGQPIDNASDLVKLAADYGFNDAGEDQFDEARGDEIVKGFRVQPVQSLTQGVYTVKIANADGNIADTFTVTVGAARVAKTVDVTPGATNVALNGQTKVKIVPKDQYGEFIANGTGVTLEVDAGDHFTKNDVTPINKDGGTVDDTHPVAAYEITLTGTTKGSNDIVVNVKNGDKVLATNKVSMTVDSVANLIDSVAVDTTDIKSVYSTEAEDPADITLKAIAKDANGVVVPVSNNDLSWTIKSVTGKVGEADATVSNVGTLGLNNGVYTPVQNFKGTVTIEVRTANMKVGEVTLNLDPAAAIAKTGTTKVVNTVDKPLDADTTKDGIQIALDNDAKDGEADGAIVLKLSAADQYGNPIDTVDITDSNVILSVDDSSVVKAEKSPEAETITLTAKSAGTANVYVQYNGDTITIPVSVNQEAAEAAEAAKPIGVVLTTEETFKGAAAVPGISQVSTIKVTAGASAAGNLTVAGVTVPVTADDDTPAEVASKIETAFADNSGWTVTANDDTLTFTAKTQTANTTIAVDAAGTGVTFDGPNDTTNGVAPVDEVKEVDTTTVTSGAQKSADITVNVSDETIDKDVTLSVSAGDTAEQVAEKIKTALAADETITNSYDVSGSGANVVLTQKGSGSDVDLQVTLK
ncbi:MULTISPECIES: hypothetical protein [Clostridium]|uniref:Uncharacterized protein n=1 Tax=Clostridium lapidicellarium TaxID=3240931 RepID=A0ABV4E1D7_9CLOT